MKSHNSQVLWTELTETQSEVVNGGLLSITSMNLLGNNSGTQKNVAVVDNDQAFVLQLNLLANL
jgi:hypothetical protein